MASLAQNLLTLGISAVLGRTYFLQENTGNGIPVPLAVLDVVFEENVDYEAEVIEHPVEAGPEVSDHIQLKNPTVRLKGRMSSTPLDVGTTIGNLIAGGVAAISSPQARTNLLNSSLIPGVVGLAGAALQGKAANAADLTSAMDAITRIVLINTFENRIPFSVVTRRLKYENCVIQKLSFPFNQETGYSMEFDINIKQLTIVSPLTVQSAQLDENVINTATPPISLSNQSTQAVSPQLQTAVQGSNLSASPSVTSKSPGFFA